MIKRSRSRPQEAGATLSFSTPFLKPFQITPDRLWLGVFGFWLFLLTGVTWSFTGSPGLVQHHRVSALLEQKQQELSAIEEEVSTLELESERLEKSPVAQEREIRKVLGYAAADELIFDFSSSGFSIRPTERLAGIRKGPPGRR